jgi:2,3-bisphosphoglycerate-independent phosphoglycerate mutase
MDRDNRFERTAVAYETIASGQGPEFSKPRLYLKSSHEAGVTDEFIVPAHLAAMKA